MARPRYGVDLDGLGYDWHSAAKFLLEHYHGISLPPVEELFAYWDCHRNYITTEQNNWLWNEGVAKGLFRHGHVRKGFIAFVEELDKSGDILVVTHRPRNARQDTLEWLAFHRIPAAEVYLLSQQEPKILVSWDVLLDDRPDTIRDALRVGRKALLWSRPWNSRDQDLNHVRVTTWKEALERMTDGTNTSSG